MSTASLPDRVFDGAIDVSHHNGAIDWPAVAAAGIALAFVKATQGAGFLDPSFAENADAAEDAGLMVVPYHFLDGSEPRRQAAHFIETADLGDGDAAMLDWESQAGVEAVVAWGKAIVAATGRAPVVYYGFAQLRTADPLLAQWPLMLPAYPQGNRPGDYAGLVRRPPRLPPGRAPAWDGERRPYDFHQYTPAGRVKGIAGPVDRSVWVGGGESLRTWFSGSATPGA